MLTFVKFLIFLPYKIYTRTANWIFILFKKVEYKSYPKISGIIMIAGQGRLKLGKNVKFNSNRSSNPIGGDMKLVLAIRENAIIEIGDNTGIANSTIVAHKGVFIGKNVKIGGSVKIYDTDFHSLDADKRKNKKTDQLDTKTEQITIHDNVFIGAHSIILKGVTIGENSIIGAGSVVTKAVPKNQIWGGNPAKYIKEI